MAIYKGRLVSAKVMQDHIAFVLAIQKDGEVVEVPSRSQTVGKTEENTQKALGMTRKRLHMIGIDMDTCSDEEWECFSTMPTFLAGKKREDGSVIEFDVLEKEEPGYGVQYEIMTNAPADTARSNQLRDQLRGVKGQPRPQAPAQRPPQPAPAPMQRPVSAPKPLGQTPAPAKSSII